MMKRVMFLILSLAVLIGMGLATSAATAKDGVFGDMRWRLEGFKNFEDLDSDMDDAWTAHYLRARLGYMGRIGDTGFYKMSVENMRVLGGDFPGFGGDLFGGPRMKEFAGAFEFWPYSIARPFGTTNSDIFVHEATHYFAWLGANEWLLSAALLALAGVYQFTHFKRACLAACRSLGETHESRHPAQVGLRHGLWCVGDCGPLMLLMFGVACGNVLLMLILGTIIAVEKNASWGRRISVPLGVLLLGCSVIVSLIGVA